MIQMKEISVHRWLALTAFSLFSVVSLAAESIPLRTIVSGRGGDAVSLEPALIAETESGDRARNIFETLVGTKPESSELIPVLAESWSVSSNRMEFTFKLRKGVRFHDGTELNADAVLFSFQRQADKDHEAHGFYKSWPFWKNLGMDKLVSEISKVDEHTVKFKLTRPEAPFIANLAHSAFSIVSPTAVRKHKASFSDHPVGTGPFKLKNWIKGENFTLEANKTYWNGKPKLDTVVFKVISDPNARVKAFLNRELNFLDLPSPELLEVIKASRTDIKVIQVPTLNLAYLSMNGNKPPFNNPAVRQAINMAIDKAALVKDIYKGMAVPASGYLPAENWGFNDALTPYPFDVAAAKTMLANAGFPNGFSTELHVLPLPRPYMLNGRKVAEAIQADLSKIGVTVTLKQLEWKDFLKALGNGDHQMAVYGWMSTNGDPDYFLNSLLSADNTKPPASNNAFYMNEMVTRLLSAAKIHPSHSERIKLYQKAQELIHKDAPWVPLVSAIDTVITDEKVKGYVLGPFGRRRFGSVSVE